MAGEDPATASKTAADNATEFISFTPISLLYRRMLSKRAPSAINFAKDCAS
jgi:hypothetical protein